jgi:hypothetical protein
MRRSGTALLTALVLSGCAVWPPGEDPRGRELRAIADTVLSAANRYAEINSRNPGGLEDLVPKYIGSLPAMPELYYNPVRGTFSFTYSPTLAIGACECIAKVGDAKFSCGICYL